jgi:succinate-acetate transporter protein
MMGVRGVENEGMFIANLLLLAGLGLVISAQWEMVRGNTFPYTVLSAFGKTQMSPNLISETFCSRKLRILLRGLWYHAAAFAWDH